jgi:hypothetical protein
VTADEDGGIVVLDGDPFKLYYSWACRRVGRIGEAEWHAAVDATRRLFLQGDCGLADLVLYADPDVAELRRRRDLDERRRRRNFELHTSLTPHFREWFRAVAELDPHRVVWEHPAMGLDPALLAIGGRQSRSDVHRFDNLIARLESGLQS